MATHSNSLAWEIIEEPSGLQFLGLKESQTRLSDLATAKLPASSSLLSTKIYYNDNNLR